MTRNFLFVAVLLSLMMSCENQDSQPVSGANSSLRSEINFVPAKTNGELSALTNDTNANIIRNISDFDALVERNPAFFSGLGKANLAEFRSSLVFKKGGIAGLAFKIVKKNLSQKDYVDLMARLGLDVATGFWGAASLSGNMRTAEDYSGYRCLGEDMPHTCYQNQDYICTSNC